MENAQLISETIYMLRRRAFIIVLVASLGTIAATLFAYILLPKYEASARILVESQQIPDELVRSTVNSTANERLQLIEQRLMSRDSLVGVIEKLSLFADRDDLTLLDQIEELRTATRFDRVSLGGGRNNSELTAFAIRVTLTDPRQAAAVANEFVSNVLQQNLKTRSDRARETLAFFEAESDRLAQALSALETQITTFKVENANDLPESLEFRRAELSRIDQSDLEIDRRLLEIEEQRGLLEAGAAQDPAIEAAVRLSPEEQRLQGLKVELVEKRMLLSEGHPEIQRLQGQIAALEEVTSAGSTADPSSESGDATGDATDQVTRAEAARAVAIERQISLLDTQITLLRDQKSALATRKAEIESSIGRTPTVETTLNALNRNHVELREQYAAISRKRAEAETGEKLEANQQAERFEVIENALVPSEPVAPNRKKIAILGAGLSVAGALGIAFLLEMLNPAIRNSAQLERQLHVAPVIAIPTVFTRGERLRKRLSVATVALIMLVGAPSGLWYVDTNIRPIESIIDQLAERTGADDVLRAVKLRF